MSICGFRGNLDEIWKHYAERHEIIDGRIKTARVDGGVFENDEWVQPKNMITNEKGEYIFECLEEI